MFSFKRFRPTQNKDVRLRLEALPGREAPAVLTWKAIPQDDDITQPYNYDTENIDPGPQHEIKFTGSPTIEPKLDGIDDLTVKKLTTDATFNKRIHVEGGLTTYASSIDGAGAEPHVIMGTGRIQFGREADDGSVHNWINGGVCVDAIEVGGSAGGASARVEIQNGFDHIGRTSVSVFNIGYVGGTPTAGQVQLKGGATKLWADTVNVSASGLLTALVSTTWKDYWETDNTSSAFVINNKGEVNIGEGAVAFLLTRGRYTDADGAAGQPKLVINAQGTFNAALNGTTYPATSAGVIISKGNVEMYDGLSTFGSGDRDVVVENDSVVKMFGGGRWTRFGTPNQSLFYINAGGGGTAEAPALRLKDNARLQFNDYNSPWYDVGSATQCGSKLTVAGHFVQGGNSKIKARGSGSVYDQIQLTGNFSTMTIGGNAKLELVLKTPAPNPMQMTIYWEDFISALQVSASSPPYDPVDISIDGGWGGGWSVSSELVGNQKVRLKFTRS